MSIFIPYNLILDPYPSRQTETVYLVLSKDTGHWDFPDVKVYMICWSRAQV